MADKKDSSYKTAFNWHVYTNRKSALCHLRRNKTLADIILETEDGSACELVHSQVMSAFGDKLTEFIQKNGHFVSLSGSSNHQRLTPASVASMAPQPLNSAGASSMATAAGSSSSSRSSSSLNGQISSFSGNSNMKLKLIRLPKLSRYTLHVLVECAYTGSIHTDLQSDGIWQILELADHYEMHDVIRACCNFLIKNLDQSNCIRFYHVGLKHQHPLCRSAWQKIRAHFRHILAANLLEFRLNPQTMEPLGALDPIAPPPPPPQAHPRDAVNQLASLAFEHYQELLMNDKLNVDTEESVWFAIKLWCHHPNNPAMPLAAPNEPSDSGAANQAPESSRASRAAELLPCMRFPRFRTGTEFSTQRIWRDSLISGNKRAQHQLAVLDRNHRDFLTSAAGSTGYAGTRDGFGLPCAVHPRQLRPRVPNSILLAIGGWQQGQPTQLIESYDSSCNLWFESKHKIMLPLAYHGIENIAGLLYICGGTNGTDILSEVFTFEPLTGDCLQRPPMREARCYVSTAHLDGYLYAMGGHNGLQRMKSVERYHIQEGISGQWTHVADMQVARSDASACVHERRIYIAGGLNDQLIESSVEFYNQLDDTWTFIKSMLSPRTSFTLIAFNNRLLAIGGNGGTERLSSVEQYDFASKNWSPHSSMRHRRSTFSACLLDQDRLIVVGGYNGQTPFNQVEMFDSWAGRWIMMRKIRYDRSGLKVVAVSDLSNASDYTYLGNSQSALTAASLERGNPMIL